MLYDAGDKNKNKTILINQSLEPLSTGWCPWGQWSRLLPGQGWGCGKALGGPPVWPQWGWLTLGQVPVLPVQCHRSGSWHNWWEVRATWHCRHSCQSHFAVQAEIWSRFRGHTCTCRCLFSGGQGCAFVFLSFFFFATVSRIINPTCIFTLTKELSFLLLVFLASDTFSRCFSFSKNFCLARISLPGSSPV